VLLRRNLGINHRSLRKHVSTGLSRMLMLLLLGIPAEHIPTHLASVLLLRRLVIVRARRSSSEHVAALLTTMLWGG
jgi:hypothetical protein